EDMQEPEAAAEMLHKCIAKDDQMTACYLTLGFNDMGQYKITDAVQNFEKAIKLDPTFAMARNNLGFCYLILLRFSEARDQFYQAYKAIPSMLIGIHLGDAFRFAGDAKDALDLHQDVLAQATRSVDSDDRYAWGDWRYNFMPLKPGDMDTIRKTIWQYSLDQKKAVAHAALSIDTAALGDFQR